MDQQVNFNAVAAAELDRVLKRCAGAGDRQRANPPCAKPSEETEVGFNLIYGVSEATSKNSNLVLYLVNTASRHTVIVAWQRRELVD